MNSTNEKKPVKRARSPDPPLEEESSETKTEKPLKKILVLKSNEGSDVAGPSKKCTLGKIASDVSHKNNLEEADVLPSFSGNGNTENKENKLQKAALSYESFLTKSQNVVHYLSSTTRSTHIARAKNQYLQSLSSQNYACLAPHALISPFRRRVTAIACHPKRRNLIAAASKGGELVFFNTHSEKGYAPVNCFEGIGPGGSIVDMQFHPHNSTIVYTAAVSGRLQRENLEEQDSSILLDTGRHENWYCSVGLQTELNIIASGDCAGNTHVLALTGERIALKRGHKGKVTSIEFCKKTPHLLLTASTDKTAKLWDFRMFSQCSFPLHVFTHNKGVNKASFNPSCTSILTTDQYDELRIYSGPWWDLETSIPHPHRQFQHLTPIKATWCPWNDELVVGRYPDEKFLPADERTIDFYDTHTGKELYRLQSHQVPGITSLNMFNCNGDTLVSGSASNVIFWRMNKEDLPFINENSAAGTIPRKSAVESDPSPEE